MLQAMFKLAQGEYVAAEKIENVLTRSTFVAQAFVYGDSLQSKLVAIIVPDPDVLLPWAKENQDLPKDFKELCKTQEAKDAVFKSVKEQSKVAQLRGFEHVRTSLTPV